MKTEPEKLQKEEELFNAAVKQYWASLDEGDIDSIEESGISLCTALTYLLAAHLQLDSSWPHEERWLDGVINSHIRMRPPDAILIQGKMVWGLRRDVGGDQWAEPFVAEVHVSAHRDSVTSYTLKFGDERGLANKLVFGSYSILSLDAAADTPAANRKYGHSFSKPGEATRPAINK